MRGALAAITAVLAAASTVAAAAEAPATALALQAPAGLRPAYLGPDLPRRPVLAAEVETTDKGLSVAYVAPGGAAERAGLHVGDIVTAVGGASPATPDQFAIVIKRQHAGLPVTFKLLRDGAPRRVHVVMPAAPREHDARAATLYRAVAAGGTVHRTLVTIPKGVRGKLPGVLVIAGYGCESIDTAYGNDPFLNLSHDLSARGFVVIRVEKSGLGDSTGPACKLVDFETEMRGYEAALAALAADPRVDAHHLYLLGHSMGGIIAPRIALRSPVRGLIVADTIERKSWKDFELPLVRRGLEQSHAKPEDIDKALALKEFCMDRFLYEHQDEAQIEKVQPACKQQNSYPGSASYIQQVAALDQREPWTKVSLPVLAIYGTADVVVARDDAERIVDLVNSRHPGTATLKLIDGMSHNLRHVGTVQQEPNTNAEQSDPPYERQLSVTVLQWLCARERCSSSGPQQSKSRQSHQ
jgi:pimeloyl-ACP methyl ester carboxylesterase